MTNRTLGIIAGALLAAALIVPAVAMTTALMGPGIAGGYGPGMMGTGGYGPGMMLGATGGWGLGMAIGRLAMLAFWAALIVGGIALLRAALHARQGDEPAGNVLRRRYAAGEITREQFDEMRQVLDGR
jgi:putative membrane protein